MRIEKYVRLSIASVIALLLMNNGASGYVQSAPQREIDRADYGELIAKARQDGFVHVIIGLKLSIPFQPEGYLSTAQAVQTQQQRIQKSQTALLNSLSRYQATAYAQYKTIPYIAMKVDEAALKALIALPQITSIEEDILVPPTLASSIPVIGADHVWDMGIEGTGWTVAVIDSGVQWDHDFLGGSTDSRVVSEACYSNSGGSGDGVTLCPNGAPSQTTGHAADPTVAGCDNSGTNMCTHGTHVAGIAAGAGSAFDGVARDANIIAIQVFTHFDDPGLCGGSAPCVSSYKSDQISGMERVYDLRTTYAIAAVNMSLGAVKYTAQESCDSSNAAMKAVIDNLLSVGIATVASVGNDGWIDGATAPGCISSAVGVGAVTDDDLIPAFSNSSDFVDLLAPGVEITSSVPINAFEAKNGTSMAAPHVAGAWALLKNLRPTATITDVRTALQTTGVSVTDLRNGITKPRIQVDMAVAALDVTTWVGNSTAWDDTNNWSTGRVPNYMANVTIPTSPAGGNFPTVNADATVHNLVIQDGAQLNMNANTLKVYGDWQVEGSGGFSATGGTVVFSAVAQDVHRIRTITMTDSANNHFFNLQIGDGNVERTVTMGSDLNIDGDLAIMPIATLIGGDRTIYLAGDWFDYATLGSDSASFVPGTSTVILDGSSQVVQKQRTLHLLEPEGFESTVPPDGWSKYQLAAPSDPGWQQGYKGAAGSEGDPSPHGGTRYAWHNDDDLDADAWLVTPQISIPSGSRATLSFWEYKYRLFPVYKYHGVQVSTSSCDPNDGEFSQLAEYPTLVYTWTHHTLDLSAYAAQTICMAFEYQGWFDDEWYIDDVEIYASGGWDGDLEFYNLIINSDVHISGGLVINGTMDLDTYNLTVEGTLTNNGTLRQKKSVPGGVTTEFLHIQNIAGDSDKYRGVDVTPAGAIGQTTVVITGNQSCTSSTIDTLVHRCYAIGPGTDQTATVRFWYTEAERNNRAANALKLWHLDGLPWQWVQVGDNYQYSESGAACVSGNCWLQADDVATYSPFGLGDRYVIWLLPIFKNWRDEGSSGP